MARTWADRRQWLSVAALLRLSPGTAMRRQFYLAGDDRGECPADGCAPLPRHADRRPRGRQPWGFTRAETMHGFYSYLEANPGRTEERRMHELSHGESVLEVLRTRFDESGLYVLDEPESALSFA